MAEGVSEEQGKGRVVDDDIGGSGRVAIYFPDGHALLEQLELGKEGTFAIVQGVGGGEDIPGVGNKGDDVYADTACEQEQQEHGQKGQVLVRLSKRFHTATDVLYRMKRTNTKDRETSCKPCQETGKER